jgi:hypothetical protein
MYQEVSGQGGHIQIGAIILLVKQWMIRKIFKNVDTTNSGSGGWARKTRVLAGWEFSAVMCYDSSRIIDGIVVNNGVSVPIGVESPVPAACIFQLGADGRQYQGTALLAASNPITDTQDVVHYQCQGEGTGPLVGPVAGQIS